MYVDRHLVRLLGHMADGSFRKYDLSPKMQRVVREDLAQSPFIGWDRAIVDDIQYCRCCYILSESKKLLSLFAERAQGQWEFAPIYDSLVALFEGSAEDAELYGYIINQLGQVFWYMLENCEISDQPTAPLFTAIEGLVERTAEIGLERQN